MKKVQILALSMTAFLGMNTWVMAADPALRREQTRMLAAMRLPTYEGKEETKEFMQERANIFAIPCYPYHFRSFSGSFETDQLPWIKKEHTKSLTNYFDSLLLKGEFNEALLLKDIYERKRKYASTASAGGFSKDMAPADVRDVTTAFEVHINQKSAELFDNLLSTEQYNKALFLATVYLEKDHARANLWLDQIRDRATTKVELHGQKSRALEAYPELVATEIEQATRLINSFPEDHELRTYLQERFDSFLTSPFPPAADESQRTILRRMTDRLFG